MAKNEAIEDSDDDEEEETVTLSVQVPADVALKFYYLAGRLDRKPPDFLRQTIEELVDPETNGYSFDLTDVA